MKLLKKDLMPGQLKSCHLVLMWIYTGNACKGINKPSLLHLVQVKSALRVTQNQTFLKSQFSDAGWETKKFW